MNFSFSFTDLGIGREWRVFIWSQSDVVVIGKSESFVCFFLFLSLRKEEEQNSDNLTSYKSYFLKRKILVDQMIFSPCSW